MIKEHVDIGHVTTFDAFRVDSDQAMDAESWLNIVPLNPAR